MTVYRELAAELRANQAVIDSLNSRNQQLLSQNQRLKQEIHNVVQATLSLGQVAGVARQASQAAHGAAQDASPGELSKDFLGAVAPDTLARLVRGGEAQPPLEAPPPPVTNRQPQPPQPPQSPQSPSSQSSAGAIAKPPTRVPRPIASRPAKQTAGSSAKRNAARDTSKSDSRSPAFRQTEAVPSKGFMTQMPSQKLFTGQSGKYQSSVLDTSENKEIGGIWLVLSIILIIVTAFGAGFLIMKPLLNDR